MIPNKYITARNLIITLFFILTGILSAQVNESGTTNQHSSLLFQLEEETRTNLTANILPFWSGDLVDTVNGGFYGRLDVNNILYKDAPRGGILNARILWTFSSAFRILNDSAYLKTATHARNYIFNHFFDWQHGGAFMSVSPDGAPLDTRKQIYTQAFFIYGLSEYYLATGDKESLSKAIEIFELIEKHGFDNAYNGYFEVCNREWEVIEDQILGGESENARKGMNTHIHVLEAYSNLYRAWPDERIAGRLRNLVELFCDKIISSQDFHLVIYFNEKWESVTSAWSYGHDIETSWLLVEAAHLLEDPVLFNRVRDISIKMVTATIEGLQPDGRLIYEKDYLTGHVVSTPQWWSQAEAVVGFVNAFELTGDDIYLDKAVDCWNYINQYLVDHESGGWFPYPSVSGSDNRRGDKAGFWICPYHNSRMCLEIITRSSQ